LQDLSLKDTKLKGIPLYAIEEFRYVKRDEGGRGTRVDEGPPCARIGRRREGRRGKSYLTLFQYGPQIKFGG
jgi:hypothetical protein